MSKYTTGEIARLCGVSVRTVQYYDKRGLLTPSEFSEGGRRLYAEQDLSRMRIICFLREAGLSINGISRLLSEENPDKVISILLQQREKELQSEVAESQKKLDMLESIGKSLKNVESFSVESIGDIAHVIKSKKKLKKVCTVLLSTAIPFVIAEWATIILWIICEIWQPFAAYALLFVPYIFWIFNYHWKNLSYICPECHEVF